MERKEMTMGAADIIQRYIAAWETQDFDVMDECLADDFQVVGPAPQPLGKRWVVADTKARWAAFPDWKFNMRLVEERGNVVEMVSRVTATHTGTLVAPIPGMPPIPPTGKAIVQPEEKTIFTLRGDKIVEMRVESVPGGGYPGILKQMGVEMP
jgi:ketosteroid isomerase-like protein